MAHPSGADRSVDVLPGGETLALDVSTNADPRPANPFRRPYCDCPPGGYKNWPPPSTSGTACKLCSPPKAPTCRRRPPWLTA